MPGERAERFAGSASILEIRFSAAGELQLMRVYGSYIRRSGLLDSANPR
jgi:hypothetical protein